MSSMRRVMSTRRPGWSGRQRRRGREPQGDVPVPPIVGRWLPNLALPFAPEGEIGLGDLARRFSLVVCLFPAIGTGLADSEDQARAEAWGRYASIATDAGYRLIAISSDDPAHQHDWLEREAPTYVVLCDQQLKLARELGLPTIRRGGRRVYQAATLLTQNARVQQVFSPVQADDAFHTTQRLKDHR
jgi:peroxiredoxin